MEEEGGIAGMKMYYYNLLLLLLYFLHARAQQN